MLPEYPLPNPSLCQNFSICFLQRDIRFQIPDILYSGNHKAIEKWRKKQSLKLTKEYRKDLFDQYQLNKEEKGLLNELDSSETPKWESDAIEKGHKFIK